MLFDFGPGGAERERFPLRRRPGINQGVFIQHVHQMQSGVERFGERLAVFSATCDGSLKSVGTRTCLMAIMGRLSGAAACGASVPHAVDDSYAEEYLAGRDPARLTNCSAHGRAAGQASASRPWPDFDKLTSDESAG